jgi:hypothetical protein
MSQRFDAGPGLAAAGALLLLLSLFVEWFSPGLSGWNAFEALDVLLAALALAALALAVARLRDPGPAEGRLLLGIGALGMLAVLVQLVDRPPLLADARTDVSVGPWLALVGCALVLVGGLLSSARIAVTVSVSDRDPRRRVRAVDRRRAPEPEGEVRGPAPAPEGDEGPRTEPFEPVVRDS